MKKIFNPNIEPACEYCAHGRISPSKKMVLCVKKGLMQPSSSCNLFKYDVLKRAPKRKAKLLPEYSPEDFAL